MPKVVSKGRCCRSRPRCQRCPVVLHRLEKGGLARWRKSLGKGTKALWKVSRKLTKKQLAAARSW